VTDQELKDLVASLAKGQAEHGRLFEETERLIAQTALEQAETRREVEETSRVVREIGERLDKEAQETGRQLREVGRQLGGLGDKFGSFTEGLALPSMTKILSERFGMTFIGPRARKSRNGRTIEIDVLGYSNTSVNAVYVVEVKSHLREEGIEQILTTLSAFPEFYPEHRDKRLYGILAAVYVPEQLGRAVLAKGLYLARISGDSFELTVPEGFKPRSFQNPDTPPPTAPT